MEEQRGIDQDILLNGGWLRIVGGNVNLVGANVNMVGGSIIGARVENADEPPLSPFEGQIFFSRPDKTFYGFDGEVWKALSM